MPKTPITSRTALYDARADGTSIDLEWNLVSTSLGTMVEPRLLLPIRIGEEEWVHPDIEDNSYNLRVAKRIDHLFGLYLTAGQQLVPRDDNR